MRNWIAFMAGAVRKFSPVDMLVLKLCLLSLGVVFGVYLFDFFSSVIAVVWIVFAASWLYVVARVFFNNKQN